MKRVLLSLFLVVFVFEATVEAQPRSPSIRDIRDCPDAGIGGDPDLNKRKNIRSSNKRSTLRTIQWMKDLPDLTNFNRNTGRAQLTRLGEGKKITVVAYALVARKGGKESCNCGLSATKDTDNHIVLVDPALKRPKLTVEREKQSVTAEFTPRVRLDHPNFSKTKLQPLINVRKRLLVRVTGLLMFDSEHVKRRLPRDNNWEIHPVLKLEYCVAATCQDTNDTGWRNLDSR
jgi:hypothetical protein